MVCWGAWCPYQNSTFSLSDSISVPLVGGPRPNADEVFCFRSLLRIRENEYEAFSDGRPRIILRFNFALVGSTDNRLLLQILSRSRAETSGRQTTPLPKPDIVVKPRKEVPVELEEESEEVITHPTPRYPVVDHIIEEPILTPYKDLSRRRTFSTFERRRETHVEADYTIESTSASVSTFSRSVLSYLARINFPQIFDRNGELPTVVDPASRKQINPELELTSRLDTSEVVLQIMAITNVKNSYISPAHKISRYFFTLQFYRFSTLTTERLVAYPSDGKKPSDPLVLKRIDDNNQVIEQNGNGLMIRLTVDKASIRRSNPDDFIQYLIWQNLYIDVWDADSLIHIGTAVLPLRFLCRQGCEAVQAHVQCPIIQAGLPKEPVATGLLYLKLANIGHPSSNQTDLYNSRNSAVAVVSQRLLRLGQGKHESYRIRAKPLNAIHESAIQRFLTAQKLDIHQRKEELFTNENINRLRQWNELKKQQVTTIPKSSLKCFIFQEELEAYKLVRNEGKASKLLKAVFKAITVQHTIQPEFGQVEFFEFVLHNTYTQPINCILDINDNRLRVITNADEWKFFKAANNLKTPLERDLIQFEDTGEISIFLNAMETVHVPFKYDPFYVMDSREPMSILLDPFEIKAIFKRADTGEPFSIFELTVQHHRHILGNSLRWFHEESTKVSKLIRIHGIRENRRVLHVRTTDSTVLCSLRNSPNGGQELLVTCHANEAAQVKTFLVMFSSEALTVMPSQPFVSTPQFLNDIKGRLKPNFSGQRTIIVTVVDVNLRRLLYAWLLNTIVCEPNILKTFEVKIPLTETKTIQRKISLENPYSVPRKYRVHTSNEEIVSPEEEYYDLEPQERVNILLNFYPLLLEKPTILEVFKRYVRV
uniref:Nephrocystin-4 n=1 Tax=Acrobeloides nanus TaxID=290746 RepID=A0A914EFR8_9BILA